MYGEDRRTVKDIEVWLLAEMKQLRLMNEVEEKIEHYNTLNWVYEKISSGKYNERLKLLAYDRLRRQGAAYEKTGDIRSFTRD